MMRWLLLIFALLLAGLASLTFWPAPKLWVWWLAVLAGEYGHWLALVALAVIWAAWFKGGCFGLAILVLCLAAIVGFLRPSVQAVLMGDEVRAALTKGFGRMHVEREPFSFLAPEGATPEVKPREIEVPIAGGREVLPMDFYAPVGRKTPAPCVVIIHGGGWDGGDRRQMTGLPRFLAGRGYAVAAISYRLAPEHPWPAQAEDIGAAIAWLKADANGLGIDARKIVLLGRSAGGQLATAYAYGRPDPAIRGVVSFYGPQDLMFAWKFSREDDLLNATKLLRQFTGGTPETAPEAYRTASAYLIATKANAVPTLLVHGAQDSLVWHKQSERMHARLNELGVPNAFISLPWATHACDHNVRGPSGQIATYALEWFLAVVTK